MSEDYFRLGWDIGLKLCRMKGSIWATSDFKDMCASVWVSVYKL